MYVKDGATILADSCVKVDTTLSTGIGENLNYAHRNELILSLVIWAILHDSSSYSAANVSPILTKQSFKLSAIDLGSDTKLSLTESSLKLFGLLFFPNNVLMSVQAFLGSFDLQSWTKRVENIKNRGYFAHYVLNIAHY